jgi:purine-binding chemotaxis protein CheW
MSSAFGISAIDKQRILRQRAERLAREPVPAAVHESGLLVVEFALGDERYAIEQACVREVQTVREITPMPCTPAFVLGIINLRGRILTVLDIRRLFDLPIPEGEPQGPVLVVRSGDVEAGILADDVTGVRTLPGEALQDPMPVFAGARADFIKGVTRDQTAILDIAAMLGDPRTTVNEEVGARGEPRRMES